METSFRWHSGIDRVTTQWSIPVPLLPDELLSSWLVRAALMQGCDPLILTGLLWPGFRAWTTDIDRGLSDERRLSLSRESGIPVEAVALTSLRPIAQAVTTSALKERAIWPWVLALGSRNISRRGGLQVCPGCLNEDAHPYYRMSGRLAWHTGCERHQRLLIDRCPACAAPLAPHKHIAMHGGAVNRCGDCQWDIGQSPLVSCSPAALRFQALADQVVSEGGRYYGEVRLMTTEWFELCRYFMTLLYKSSAGRSVRLSRFLSALGVDCALLPITETGLVFEALPVHERSALLSAVVPLLDAGPLAFKQEALKQRLAASALHDTRQALPACLRGVIQGLPEQRRSRTKQTTQQGPSSKQTVLRKLARLKRKMLA